MRLEGILGVLISLVIIKAGVEILLEPLHGIIGSRPDEELTAKVKAQLSEKFSAMIELNAVKFLPTATKFLKKLKDKKLKNLFADAVKKICENPEVGEEKTGDLQGVRCVDVFYNTCA